MFKDFDAYRDDMVSGIDAFLDGKALVYLSDTSDMGTILGMNAAQYDAVPIDVNQKLCSFTDAWVMKECSEAEEKAGKAILEFFLSNSAQTSGYIENGRCGIPLEINTVNEFIENKSTLADFKLDFNQLMIAGSMME